MITTKAIRMENSLSVDQRNVIDDFQTMVTDGRQANVARMTKHVLVVLRTNVSVPIEVLSGECSMTLKTSVTTKMMRIDTVVQTVVGRFDRC
jgi:hypothetical protein